MLPVVDPATEEVIAEVPSTSPVELDAAMAAAAAAQPGWAAGERSGVLHQVADVLDGAKDELATLLSRENGKPVPHAAGEVDRASASFRYYADLAVTDEVLQDDEAATVVVERVPIGVVAAITPWNFPIAMASWKLAPALRAGNTVVVKPSPFTPLSTIRIGELLRDVLPPGVVTVVTGGAEVGVAMVEHPVPGKVSFTGSVATGRSVAAGAARDVKRLTLELGGNDAAIVLDDVDLDAMAKRLFWSAFSNNGHACVAVKRVFAPRRRVDDVVEALAACATAARVGPPAEPKVQLGPVSNKPQLDRVEALVASGGTVVAGGKRLTETGYFYAPTIVTGLNDDAPLVAEEQFGPVLPVVVYDDLDDAVARANAGHFGLGASVWSSDGERADAVAARLVAGTVWVNDHGVQRMDQPIGGVRFSGFGVENGPRGLDAYADLRVRYRSRR